jgi:hypothetical protein
MLPTEKENSTFEVWYIHWKADIFNKKLQFDMLIAAKSMHEVDKLFARNLI